MERIEVDNRLTRVSSRTMGQAAPLGVAAPALAVGAHVPRAGLLALAIGAAALTGLRGFRTD
jgi:hypothetical protein